MMARVGSLENHRALIEAELAINEGGGGTLRDGKPVRNSVQLAEKIYQTYRLEVTDPGGHSASGRRDSAIYRLPKGFEPLSKFDFPVRLNPVTRGYFERAATTEQGDGGASDRRVACWTQRRGFDQGADGRPPLRADQDDLRYDSAGMRATRKTPCRKGLEPR